MEGMNHGSGGSASRLLCRAVAIAVFTFSLAATAALATPHAGQSVNVVIIGGASVMNGGSLPTSGPAGELGDFAFTTMAPAAVNAVSLAPYDTAVLNVANSAMGCRTSTLSASQKADLVAFVTAGKKLIIYDSECTFGGNVDYSWLPVPFTTSNPGAYGATGTITILEDNLLSHQNAADPHYINAVALGTQTDAAGDANVMVTLDPNWCLDMSATNVRGITGPVHTYASLPLGTDHGLIIYNGLDVDYMGSSSTGAQMLRKLWVQELQQPFNPSGLPCVSTVVGISLNPLTAANPVGTTHTVTATLTDLLGNPQPGIVVTFTVIAGPNAGLTGADTTDAAGQATWSYSSAVPGTDQIQASFVSGPGAVITSRTVTKDWVVTDVTPPTCRLTGTIVGPPAGIQVTLQDGGSGLAAVNVLTASNATVVVPPFAVGTTSPVVVTATKINAALASKVILEGVDVAGNRVSCDPEVVVQFRQRNTRPTLETLEGVPQEESKVTIVNGSPGLKVVTVTVNGKRFVLSNLKDGETRVLNVASAMVPGTNNTLELMAQGKPGGSALVVVSD